MSKEKPLWQRIYRDVVYVDIIRLIGYAGCTYRDMLERLKPLEERFDSKVVQQAAYHIVVYEGQDRTNVAPLAQVMLRPEVRKLAWGLLGPPEDHPDYERLKSPEPFVLLELAPTPAEEPKKPRRRSKKE